MEKEISAQITCTNPKCGHVNDTAAVKVHHGLKGITTEMWKVPLTHFSYVWCERCGRMLELPSQEADMTEK